MIDLTKVCCFDLETTGIDINADRIVQFAAHKEGAEPLKIFVDPEMEISEEAISVHGITQEMVADAPIFKDVAQDILNYFDGCAILIGYNFLNFDLPLLYAEFDRAGIEWDYKKHRFVDVRNIFVQQAPRTLEAAMEYYCGEKFVGAHDALNDVVATSKVFSSQLRSIEIDTDNPDAASELEKYSNFGRPILELTGKFVQDDKGQVVFNFGKNKGKLALSDMSYLRWMATSDFPACTKKFIKDLVINR